MKSGIGSHTRAVRGQTDDWITPREIIEALGDFDLDPCCSDTQPWHCARVGFRLCDGNDGLVQPWFGRVYLNSPYGPQTVKWLELLARHGRGTALIFARTETSMFHEWVWRLADGILFLEGRLYFHHPDGRRASGNAGGPSCLVAYGAEDAEILRTCKLKGAFVIPTARK